MRFMGFCRRRLWLGNDKILLIARLEDVVQSRFSISLLHRIERLRQPPLDTASYSS